MENFSFLSAAEVDAMDILRKKIKRIAIPIRKEVTIITQTYHVYVHLHICAI